MKITSTNNDLVKEVCKLQQKKYRDETGLFLLEGDKCIEEAIQYGIKLKHIFVIENYDKFRDYDRIETTEAVLAKISTTVSPPKAVAVGFQIVPKWDDTFNKIILLENIKDAGNLGTILRTACAFSIDAVILYGDTVDLYNPKCVRSSVGNIWKVPVFCIKNPAELELISKNYKITGTLPKSENTIWLRDYKFSKKELIMFGAESTGLSEQLKSIADDNITIEMSKNVESLNLGISVAVIAYNWLHR